MVSDFRRKKLQLGFEFLDTDKSGTVEKVDFELVVERLKKSRGLQDGDERLQKVADFMMKVWDGIQKEADSDNDGHVSSDDWFNMWDRCAKNPTPAEWQTNLTRFIFRVLDAKSDDVLDADEFITVTTSFGRKKEEAETSFKKISKGNSTVSYADFQELWKDYISSEDKDAPGNFIFGRTSF